MMRAKAMLMSKSFLVGHAGTPSSPETLYHLEVLEDYEQLGLRCGVSSGSEFLILKRV